MNINYEAVINGTPTKRINNAYELMKANYNKDSAKVFYDTFTKESLSDIIENSRLIFSEPYYGLTFFEDVIMNPKYCQFNKYISETEKIKNYIEDNSIYMNDEQKNRYTEVLEKCNDLLKNYYNQIVISKYFNEKDEDLEKNIGNFIYNEESHNDILPLFKDESMNAILLYGPYLNESCKDLDINKVITEGYSNPEIGWFEYVNRTAIMNKLYADDSYVSECKDLSHNSRLILESYSNENLMKGLSDLVTESSSRVVFHSDPKSAVLSIFDDMLEAQIYESDNSITKNKVAQSKLYMNETVIDILKIDYDLTESTDNIAKGYSVVENCSDYTVEDLMKELLVRETEYQDELPKDFFEKVDDDVTDDDIDNMEKDVSGDDDHQSTKKAPTSSKPKKTKKVKKEVHSNTVDVAPDRDKPKLEKQPFANRVQTKAQDIQVKQANVMGKITKNLQAVGNAAKAVTTIPKNVIDSIKDTIHKLDTADDDRRKEYMTEPGFRKRVFRNIKLAILYGSAATYKLSAVPMVWIVRHFSKEKDKRIQNELQRELRTNIKVCEAKIQDAESEGNKQEKYRLIRIKDQLENELQRVAYNSKYI